MAISTWEKHVEFQTRIVNRVVKSVVSNPEAALPKDFPIPNWLASCILTDADIFFAKKRVFFKSDSDRRRHRERYPSNRDVGVFAST